MITMENFVISKIPVDRTAYDSVACLIALLL